MVSEVPPRACRILVVDDEPEIINLVRMMLERERSDEVLGANGDREGIAVARNALPDLVILDIMMPNPDGFETLAEMRSIPDLRDTPVLFIAALRSKAAYPMVKEAGGAGYLEEPFTSPELLAARDSVLRGEVYYPVLPDEGGQAS
jgi:CheY-like chemotaxis protein